MEHVPLKVQQLIHVKHHFDEVFTLLVEYIYPCMNQNQQLPPNCSGFHLPCAWQSKDFQVPSLSKVKGQTFQKIHLFLFLRPHLSYTPLPYLLKIPFGPRFEKGPLDQEKGEQCYVTSTCVPNMRFDMMADNIFACPCIQAPYFKRPFKSSWSVH